MSFNRSLTRVTRGLIQSNHTSPIRGIGLGVVTLQPSQAPVSASNLSLLSVATYDTPVGSLEASASPDGLSVKVKLTTQFPTNYRRFFAILRGRYEYKTNTTDNNVKILYTNNDFIPPSEVNLVDDELSAGYYYYYSVVALVGDSSTPAHLVFNRSTGFDSCYAYKDNNYSQYLFNVLPEEWRVTDTDGFVESYVTIFGKLFDSIKTDIEVNIRDTYDITNSRLEYLEYLGSIIGWDSNEELDGELQREELKNITSVYKKKGKNESIKYLIELITSWNVSFEEGYDRVIRSNTQCLSPSLNNIDSILNKDYPELTITELNIGTSDGLSSQTFDISYDRAKQFVIEVDNGVEKTEWLQVDSFVGQGSTSECFTITDGPSGGYVVTFGDGTNGAIPELNADILASFKYGGDYICYSPARPPEWIGLTGYRILLQNTDLSEPLTSALVNKVFKVVEEFKASYAVYDILLGPLTLIDNFVLFEDEFTDSILQVDYFITNDSNSLTNQPLDRTPIII